MDIERHTSEIIRLRRAADELPDDVPAALMTKIEHLAKCMVYVGRLSSHLDGTYKRVYAERVRARAEAYINAPSPREPHAELAVTELRQMEAQAYEDMHRWRNAFEALREEIHALKMKQRIDFADGTVGDSHVRTESRAEATA